MYDNYLKVRTTQYKKVRNCMSSTVNEVRWYYKEILKYFRLGKINCTQPFL